MTDEVHQHAAPKSGLLSNDYYNVLKFVAQIFLPALGTFYFALAQIWAFSNGVEVVGTITAVDTFLGFLLGLSTKRYNKSDAKYDGVINVMDNGDGTKAAALVLKNYENPADVVQQKEVTFKVQGNPS